MARLGVNRFVDGDDDFGGYQRCRHFYWGCDSMAVTFQVARNDTPIVEENTRGRNRSRNLVDTFIFFSAIY